MIDISRILPDGSMSADHRRRIDQDNFAKFSNQRTEQNLNCQIFTFLHRVYIVNMRSLKPIILLISVYLSLFRINRLLKQSLSC